MNKKLLYTLSAGIATVLPFALNAGEETPAAAPNGSQIETQLRIDVKDDINTVHLTSTSNDPDVITKVYVLKNIDPYELIPYIRGAVGAERISDGSGHVEAIKYMDGTGVLIVSAEEYKFDKESQDGGMNIDEVIAALDQPNAISSSGHTKFMYFPKYRNANTLKSLLQNNGLQGLDSEANWGRDRVSIDSDLNAMLFDSPSYSNKTIADWVLKYDQPLPEVKVKCTVYEIGLENDGKIGLDFQAWKNGPGSDLFSTAARASSGWAGAFSGGTGYASAAKFGATKYVKFSPRWNTRFLDFLVTKGKAKVVTAGEMVVRNAEQGRMSNMTTIPYLGNGNQFSDIKILDYKTYTTPVAITGNTEDGTPIVFGATTAGTTLRVSRVRDLPRAPFFLEVSGGDLSLNGKIVTNAKAYNLKIDGDAIEDWSTDKNITIKRNFKRDTETNGYGFTMTVTPTICQNATTLDVELINTSLIGFEENGTGDGVRTSTSEVNSIIQVNNNGSKFIIGGLEKASTVSSVSKVPWLGSIPILGWLFTSESEVTKKAQLVTVIEVVPVTSYEGITAEEQQLIDNVNGANVEAGVTNKYGYDQFLLDSEKSLDPLP